MSRHQQLSRRGQYILATTEMTNDARSGTAAASRSERIGTHVRARAREVGAPTTCVESR